MYAVMPLHAMIYSQIQRCDHVKQTYSQGGCCDASPTKTVADSLVFPKWSTRFDMNDLKNSRYITLDGSTFDAAADTLGVELMRRYPTVSEKATLSGKSVSQIVKTMGYYDTTLALKNATFMKESETGSASGKAFVSIGGGFAIEACMAFVRAGGHCYFTSRTHSKRERIIQSVTRPSDESSHSTDGFTKLWMTARSWSEVNDSQKNRIHWEDSIDCRDHASIDAYFTKALADMENRELKLVGVYITPGTQRMPPTYNKDSQRSITDDIVNYPDFFNNTNPYIYPGQYVTHYYSHLYVVEALNRMAEGGSFDAHDVTIVHTSSHVSLFSLEATNDVKYSHSPFSGFVDAEYVLAKKQTEYVRKVAERYKFKTALVYPIGCETDWGTPTLTQGSWFSVYYGVSQSSDLNTDDAAAGQRLCPGNAYVPAYEKTPANSEKFKNNLVTYFSDNPTGIAEVSQFQLPNATFAAELMMSTMDIGGALSNPNIAFPRASRITRDGRYEVNNLFILSVVNLFKALGAISPKYTPLVDSILDTCAVQFNTTATGETEAFCVLPSIESVALSAVLPAVVEAIGVVLSPIASPFSIGFAAATAVLSGLDNQHYFQYGLAGSFLVESGLTINMMGSNDPDQDANLLDLQLDLAASKDVGFRYARNTTFLNAKFA